MVGNWVGEEIAMKFTPYKTHMEIDTMDGEFITDTFNMPVENVPLVEINEFLASYVRYTSNPDQLELNLTPQLINEG